MDVLKHVYDTLIADTYILSNADGRIKYYEYPETGDVTGPFVIIDPLDVPTPKDFADNTWLTYDCLLQIEVWTKNRTTTRILAEHVRKAMWDINFHQAGGMDEWDKETGIFRDARRYRGKIYRNDLDSL